MEVIFPPPFMADSRSVRLSLFYDVGNVFASTNDFSADELRMSAGLAAVWLSPVGPLSVSVAQAFNDQSNDDTQFFQFNLGAGF